jgi:hypothetical protein
MRIRGAMFTLLMVVAVMTIKAPAALAQDNCQEFKALMQATLVTNPGTLPPALAGHFWEFSWGGVVYSTVGDDGSYLGGWFYGKDAADPFTPVGNGKTVGRGKDGLYMFAFGTHVGDDWAITDSFDIQLGQAVWTVEPGGPYAGSYKASGKMVNGTGRFAGATGSFTLHGDFGVWNTDTNEFGFVSAWNPALTGKFCK